MIRRGLNEISCILVHLNATVPPLVVSGSRGSVYHAPSLPPPQLRLPVGPLGARCREGPQLQGRRLEDRGVVIVVVGLLLRWLLALFTRVGGIVAVLLVLLLSLVVDTAAADPSLVFSLGMGGEERRSAVGQPWRFRYGFQFPVVLLLVVDIAAVLRGRRGKCLPPPSFSSTNHRSPATTKKTTGAAVRTHLQEEPGGADGGAHGAVRRAGIRRPAQRHG